MAHRRVPAAEKLQPVPPRPFADIWASAVAALGLSPRQAKIVELILQGKKDKQIAAELGLSKHTIRTYLNRIFSRLGVSDRVGLVLKTAASRPACENAKCPYRE